MRDKIRPRITYANVMSTVAVFFAIGGGAVYAAGKINTSEIQKNAITGKLIERNAIGGSEIKRNAIGGSEIKRSAVGGSEIKPNAIKGPDIKPSVIEGLHIKPTTVLPIVTTLKTETYTLDPEADTVRQIKCDSGEAALGGGFEIVSGPTAASELTDVVKNAPVVPTTLATTSAWELALSSSAVVPITIKGYVTCVDTLSL